MRFSHDMNNFLMRKTVLDEEITEYTHQQFELNSNIVHRGEQSPTKKTQSHLKSQLPPEMTLLKSQ